MDHWVLDNLHLKQANNILDLGCGTGKHLFRISSLVGREGLVVGADISEESLMKCEKKKKKLNRSNIQLIKSDMACLRGHLEPGTSFHRILSAFSLYYSQDCERTLRELRQLLRPNGILFICGPTKENNLEFLRLVKCSGGLISKEFNDWTHFLEKIAFPTLKRLFPEVEISFFKNPIEFPSCDVLYNYWRATTLYKPSLESKMIALIKKHFESHPSFVTHKVVIGLKARKHE